MKKKRKTDLEILIDLCILSSLNITNCVFHAVCMYRENGEMGFIPIWYLVVHPSWVDVNMTVIEISDLLR
jgi:hypothetical protein